MTILSRKVLFAGLMTAAFVTGLSGQPAAAKTLHHHHHRPVVSHHTHGRGKTKTAKAPVQDARQLFSAKKLPAAMPASSIGFYAAGCLAGAEALPRSGATWDVMRLSRNRAWGTPRLVDYIKHLSVRAHADGWTKVLIGDMSMPRGGPMPTGHASHNIGLDADLWLRPGLADRPLTDAERESWGANSVLQIDSNKLDPKVWTPEHGAFVRDAAQDPNVTRIFVTPAIKQYLCARKDPNGGDTEWLRKLRPCDGNVCEGHDDHIHVRLSCTKGDTACKGQAEPAPGDGCGAEVTDALRAVAKDPPYNSKPPGPFTPKAPFALSRLPKACIAVLHSKP
jgi:penicillin-insensitive murein endopeptidase